MILLEMLGENLIKVGLESQDKEELFQELLDLLVRANKVKDRRRALEALWAREKKGNTNIGHGVAVPHTKTSAVEDLCLALGISKDGIDFESAGEEPVHIIFLMIATENHPGLHVEALADIATLVEAPGVCRRLLEAKTAKEALAVIAGEAKVRLDQ